MTAHDRDFEDWVAQARKVTCMQVAERRGLALSQGRDERTGPCPGCGGRDRFRINVRKDFFACRGCEASGRSILLVQLIDGCDFLAAVEELTGRPPPRGQGTRLSPAELAARAQAQQAQRAAQQEKGEEFREEDRVRAFALWKAGTRFAPEMRAYFNIRRIHLPPAFCARYLPAAPYFHGEEEDERGRKRPRLIYRGPAILLPIQDSEFIFRGLHITWIDPERPKGKAEIVDPATGELLPAKKVRGSKTGNRILLVPAERAPSRQVSGEGPETVMSVWTSDLITGRLRPETEYVSAVDLGNLAGKAADRVAHPTATRADKRGRVRAVRVPGPTPALEERAMFVPTAITHLTLLADGDSDPFTTRLAMQRAATRHAAPERRVTVAWPPDGFDFNDVLLGRHLGRVA